MPNPKGKPENLPIYPAKGEEPLEDNLSFRVTKSMKEEVKAHDDPAEFCRRAIQEALDKEKKK
ncbi:hypothetical protein I8748_14205 [Nostoc sp. CENA67]|uniref:Uncharacterized protein n=1 Tax=Amazonocrinis nigriterrae CENA67 TaxID=2794033 RepID=A0A8J7HVW9_9NOST|nr:hypothetical protein [Amazonocrinis nigriterrae]MBH8563324.1 hypothetical protein [Amazonocrinis nigriterrae CENA67]